MPKPSAKLRDLIEKLDSLPTPISLVDLADAYAAVDITLEDVTDYIEQNPRHYNRSLVALREHFELLVMTWMPGQASVPHDHAGSICVMKVLQGDAIEGQYQVARDGYVDGDYDCTIPSGCTTAGEDAGVHVVRNAAGAATPLVTLHAYAPPLRDFRRFVPRPPSATARVEPEAAPPTIVVVGGGFSGSMAAAQLLRKASETKTPLRVMLVERRGAVAEGVAYGTRDMAHLLNVPAGKMSAWPDQPEHFVNWARTRNPNVAPTDFLPRMWFGEYVRETLVEASRQAAPLGELQVVFDEVRRVGRRPDGGWLVHMAKGKSQHAAAVVLAVGHRPPSDPFGPRWNGPKTRFIADPWRPFALNVIRPNEAVVVLGSGLTAVDAVMSLSHAARTAPITILSRRGLMPHSHAANLPGPLDLTAVVDEWLRTPGGVRILGLLNRLRKFAKTAKSEQKDWRSVVDGIRPHTAKIWQALPAAERRRFMARLQPFWEVHRHRMALSIGATFGELRDCDWVHRLAGRVVAIHAKNESVQVVVARRGDGRIIETEAQWVVNCTGPAPSNSASSNPAIGSLLVDGWLRPDPLGLGVETDAAGRAICSGDKPVDDLLVVGTLRKPTLWETTAVPELRVQAAEAAKLVIEQVAASRHDVGRSL